MTSHEFLDSRLFTSFVHILLWLILIHLGFNIFGLSEGLFNAIYYGGKYIDEAFIIIPSLIIFFYWNSTMLIPKLLNKRHWWKYLVLCAGSFLFLFHVSCRVFDCFIDQGFHSELAETTDFFDMSLMFHLIVLAISTSLGVTKIAIRTTQQKERLEKLKKETEIKYLKTQFNPHFLFNTLNGIYSQALEENAVKTTELLLHLSEIMRYPIKNIDRKFVHLEEEIKFIEDFITLQQLRLGVDYPITFIKRGQIGQYNISPFILITIVENAFKFGISQHQKTPLSFALTTSGDKVSFSAINHIVTNQRAKSHKIGLTHLQERLNLEYSGKHELIIKEQEETFDLKLVLQVSGHKR